MKKDLNEMSLELNGVPYQKILEKILISVNI
jgi:hypothetical protein